MNYVRTNDAKLDELLENGRATSDAAQRQVYYTELLNYLIDECPSVPLFFEQTCFACDADLNIGELAPSSEHFYYQFSW